MKKYNFDEVINRENTYSAKWCKDGFTKDIFGGCLPEDRICLHVADMDFKCPPSIIKAMHEIASQGIYGYSNIPICYYKAVQSWYARRMNFHFDIDDIFYMPGTHTAIAKCISLFSNVNDGVIILTPSYSYHSDVETINRKYIKVEMINNNGYYTIDFDAFEKACKEKDNTIFILCNPHNPTGRVFNIEELQRIGKICKDNNVLIISDEVHSDLIRKDVTFHPIMNVIDNEDLIVATAVNKTFNLAGLQMTNVIVKNNKYKEVLKKEHYMATPFGIASVLAAYNESEDWVDELNEYLDESIDEVIDFINKHLPKCKVYRPEGTYILWLDFSCYNLTDEQIRDKIYNKARVVAQGGTNYDEVKKEQFQRLCIANPKAQIIEALKRIAKEFN